MKDNLYQLAKKYVDVIKKIEETTDAKTIQVLEEKRVQLHGEWLDMLKAQGIKFHDREHATKIAYKIARGEL